MLPSVRTMATSSFAQPVEGDELRRTWLRERWEKRSSSEADRHRDSLTRWYGEAKPITIKYAEAFAICEYGKQPTPEEIRKLFPFLIEPK